MSKNKRILILTLIFFVILVTIFGFSYAHYLIKIKDNTSEKSISVKSANLAISYEDGNALLKIDSLDVGTTTEVKTFTVTNDGDDIVENYAVFFENVINELERPEDLVYGITCYVYNTDEYENNSQSKPIDKCDNIKDKNTFPTGSGKTLIVTNDIEVGKTHLYKLTVTYLESHEDQTLDIGKKISAKINIDTKADNIILSNVLLTSGETALENKDAERTLLKNVETSVSSQINNLNERILAENPDDYGTSYYYRGNIKDNYINFNGMCWRIVRIQGDGSIKIILEDKDAECNSNNYTGNWNIGESNYGYTNMYITNSSGVESSTSKNVINYIGQDLYQTNPETSLNQVLNSWFNNNINDKAKIKKENWCIGDSETIYDYSGNKLTTNINDLISQDSTFYYNVHKRLYRYSGQPQPTLKCVEGDTYESYIATLTADEATFAGGKVLSANTNGFYLVNSYQKNNSLWFWLLAPFYNTTNPYVLQINSYANVSVMNVNQSNGGSRPVIVLKANTIISGGNGTQTSPYII